MKSTFKDSVAIVTGGASGIGQALGEQIAQLGAEMVILADINLEKAEDVACNLQEQGHQARAVGFDVIRAADVQGLVAETVSLSIGVESWIQIYGASFMAPWPPTGS
jgi:NAD(P)-dependent dehydrogenase (short-subunit alcohol dehydrogenase family)